MKSCFLFFLNVGVMCGPRLTARLPSDACHLFFLVLFSLIGFLFVHLSAETIKYQAVKYILLPEPETIHQLPFYFAVEEYVARHYTDDEYFVGWRVNPTVMLGRNQLIDNEVNTGYCKLHDARAAAGASMPTKGAYSSPIFRAHRMPTRLLPAICNAWPECFRGWESTHGCRAAMIS